MEKKAIKRQYLEVKSRAGVYAIRNHATGRALIAGAPNVEGVLNRHRFELRFGQHRNKSLMKDWQTFGESGFSFEVLDRIKPSDDPAFNAVEELAQLVNLWRVEMGCQGALDYAENLKEAP